MRSMQSLARTGLSRALGVRHKLPGSYTFPALTQYRTQQETTVLIPTSTPFRQFQSKSKSDQSLAEASAFSARPLDSDIFALDYRSESAFGETSTKEQIKPKRRGRGPSRKKKSDVGAQFYRPPSTATSTSWSSPHDNVARQSFMKNYSHLWTLLEACLDTQNFARAEDVLISFSAHSSPKDITVAVNNYLLRLAEVNESDASVAQSWLKSISIKLGTFTPDSVTYAIILRNICLATDYDKDAVIQHLNSTSPDRDVLKHVDVLGIEMISKIIKVCVASCFIASLLT